MIYKTLCLNKYAYYLVLLMLLWATPALAHRSPEGCLGSGLNISLYTDPSQVRIGDTIVFRIDVFNGIGSGPAVCDAANIQAFITTPDDQVHPITLLRTTLLNGEKDSYPTVVTYTSRLQDIKDGNILKATASTTGNIHQNDTDSQGGGNQSVNITVLPEVVVPPEVVIPPVVIPPTPVPSTSSGGGSYVAPILPTSTPIVNIPIVATSTATTSPIIIVPAPLFPKTGLSPKWKDFSRNVVWTRQLNSKFSNRIIIPRINVDTTLESVGLTSKGRMDVPKDFTNAAWFNLGPRPGEKGNSVIDGHFGGANGIPAVFDNLNKLQKGDKIYIVDEKGVTTYFIVREFKVYNQHEDTSSVFNSSDGKAHLNLITCTGAWDKKTNSYASRLVVFADREIE